MRKMREAALKTPIISLIVLIGISALIFFVTDSMAREKASELENISRLNWVIPLGDYEHIEHLQNRVGLFAVKKDSLAGVVGANGDMIIPCVYDYIGGGGDGLIRAILQGKQGYLDEAGRVIIPFIYDEAFDFRGGYALVALEGHYHVIDTNGRTVYKNSENYQMYPTEKAGIFSFWKGDSLEDEWDDDIRKSYKGLIDARIRTVLVQPDRYQEVFHFSEGFWLTSLYPKGSVRMPVYVFLDENLNEAFHGKVFHEAQTFSEGLTAVALIEGAADREHMPDSVLIEWGYMDKEGMMLESDLHLERGGPFSDGLAGLSGENCLFFINASGEKVLELEREGNFKFAKETFQEGFAPVATRSSELAGRYGMIRYSMPRGLAWGYVDKKGGFVVPPILQDASPVAGGLAVVVYAGKYGVIAVGEED